MAGSVPSVDYLILNVLHRTNEDWYLELKLAIDPSQLIGARVVSVLKDRKDESRSIVLECTIENGAIVQRLDRRSFENKQGLYSGDVLLTLSEDRDMVTHVINLELQKGVSPHG